jgi:3-oxoacyl-[acyl-carrier protein] reductase
MNRATQHDLAEKVAIVTGSSRGIGSAIARELAARGALLTLTGRDEIALRAIGADITAAGAPEPLLVVGDLREAEMARRLVAETVAARGRLDILVNNAGATKRGDFLSLTDEDFFDGFALKFHATVRTTRHAWPALVSSAGTIVNIVGIGARTPARDFTIGGPVNSAILNFSKAMADRGLGDGVRVVAVNPGHIVTDRLHRRIAAAASAAGISTAEAEKRARDEIGIRRFGRPEEIAAFVAFLCSPAAAYIHGAVLDIDGGATKGL